MKKYKISSKNILGHSDVAPDRKKDPGEKFPWKYLAKNKVSLWHTLKKKELMKNRNFKTSKLEKELFLNNLFKFGYSKKTPKDLSRDRYLRYVTKAFQRRFRQKMINGVIDQECLLISKNLIKIYN